MGSARPGGLSSGGTRSRHAAVFELLLRARRG